MTRRFSLLLIALAVVAAGCGGDDALTEEEFLAQGNEICAAGSEKIDDAAEETFGESRPTPDEEQGFVIDTVLPATQEQVDALDELEPPDELEDQVESVLSDARAEIDALNDDPGSLSPGSFAEVNAAAVEIGLDACAG